MKYLRPAVALLCTSLSAACSGNTSQSGGPHLHFDVQKCGPNLPPNYNALPCGQTLPVTFKNTHPHACGLKKGTTYPAQGS